MKRIITFIYLLLQLVLYLLSVFIDNNLPTNILEYSIILINLLFSGYLIFKLKSKDSKITFIALLFTLISDTFLVLLHNFLTIAMISFSFTQIFYYIRIKNLNNENNITKKDVVRFCTIGIFLIIMIVLTIDNIDSLIIITTFYFLMLIFNFIDSLKTLNKYPYLSIGLFLFICCDVFVGLNFLEGSLPSIGIIDFLLNVDFVDMVWFFYVPSQVILTLSVLFNKKSHEVKNY